MYKFNPKFFLIKLGEPQLALKKYNGELIQPHNEIFWDQRQNRHNPIIAWDYYRELLATTNRIFQSPKSPLLGIEIEAEYVSQAWHGYLPVDWKWHADGSLRHNGAEFISLPLQPEALRSSLCALWTLFKVWQRNNPPRFGWRTSTHIHMDMRKKTSEHLVKILLCYLAFEESLFEFAGPARKESVFCVPLTRTPFHYSLSQYLNGEREINDLVGAVSKYAALNLQPLFTQGTIEFRAMEGTRDLNRIVDWVNLLLSLEDYCQRASLEDLVSKIKLLNTNSQYDAFKQEVFGRYADLVDAQQTQPHMSDCIKYVKECLSPKPPMAQPPESSGLIEYYKQQIDSQEPQKAKKKSVDEDYIQIIEPIQVRAA